VKLRKSAQISAFVRKKAKAQKSVELKRFFPLFDARTRFFALFDAQICCGLVLSFRRH